MEYRKFEDKIFLRLDPGDEILSSVQKLCEREDIRLASLSGIGAADKITVGVYSLQKKEYMRRTYEGDFEISSVAGNVTFADGKPYLHLHITFGNPDENIFACGHLNEAVISATCEIVLDLLHGSVGRKKDATTGLNVADFV